MISVGKGLSLFLGGARSGKSDMVVRLAERWSGPVTFVATATAGDDDMAVRIERHQLDRPHHWSVIEAPRVGADDISTIRSESLVIVDCITMLVANLVFGDISEPEALGHVEALGSSLAERTSPTLVVSNEVGLGVHPPTELGRDYRDLLGRANRVLAGHAETTLFVVAGQAMNLDDVEPSW